MKKLSKLFIVFAIVICSLIACVPGNGSASDIVVCLQIDNPIMSVNGVKNEIDSDRGTSPVVTNGRTLVPIRAIIEAFNGGVEWEESTKTVTLKMSEDVIQLIIDSDVAYLNGRQKMLDVAPTVINGRTMLPIRFVAEGFNLGVAWEGESRTVSIIKNDFDEEEYKSLMKMVPEYFGQPYTRVNQNKPFFKDYEIINGSFEYYESLDELGRCGVALASVSTDIMPTEERESISSVKPTGWYNAPYDHVDGKYLYNRCHLIGFQLTGENANERNLITGTRYLNVEGMLPFENQVDDYIEETGNQVMYRVTPVFTENNLVADGVLMEGYSVEDKGQGISFCVFCYNVQPKVKIDYLTGYNSPETEMVVLPEQQSGNNPSEFIERRVYRTQSGKRYHFGAECGGKNSYETTLEDAMASGLTPCAKCED